MSRVKGIGSCMLYYSNTDATFRLKLLVSGDVSPNPGPLNSEECGNTFPVERHFVHNVNDKSYTRLDLLQFNVLPINQQWNFLHPNVMRRITSLRISRNPNLRKRAHRGKRGGRRKQRKIPVLVPQFGPNNKTCAPGINHNNLIVVNTNTQKKYESCLKIRLWNAHSVRNKTFLLHDYISEHDIDIMLITETWLRAKKIQSSLPNAPHLDILL